jgi:hypothetical protein
MQPLIPILALVTPLYLIAIYFLVYRQLDTPIQKTFLVLSAVGLVIGGLHALVLVHNLPGFWNWFLDGNAETSLETLFGVAQLIAVAMLALALALRGALPSRLERGYWLLVFVLFAFLSVDESGIYQLHESIRSIAWREIYVAAGMVMAGGIIAFYWFGARQRTNAALFVGGLVVMGFSGLFFERMAINGLCGSLGLRCRDFFLLEEFFETVGGTIVLVTILQIARLRLDSSGWRLGKAVLALGTAGMVLWVMGNLWLFPTLEAALLARPAQVEYFDGAMSLVGYQFSKDIVRPGDSLTINLYWRVNDFLKDDYNWSVRALTHPDIETVAVTDLAESGIHPSSAWIPGLIVRKPVTIQISEDAPVPRSYWIMMGVWHNIFYPDSIKFTATDRPQLADDQVILDSIPALAIDPPGPPPIVTDYRFQDNFTLRGYDVPEAVAPDQELALRFWWDVDNTGEQDYTQIIHLYHTAEERYYIFDQEPFGGGFPTSEWPEGIRLLDTRRVSLEGTMPAGDYRLLIGMYDQGTLERLPIVDQDGQPLADHIIDLAGIQIVVEN